MAEAQMLPIDTMDKFRRWRDEIPIRLAHLAHMFPKNSEQLDRSRQSLGILDEYLMSNYTTSKDILQSDQISLFDSSATYIGETFISHLGGMWGECISNPDHMYFGYPILTGIPDIPVAISPHAMILSRLKQRGVLDLPMILSHYLERNQRKG
jgi:hypothetical protein